MTSGIAVFDASPLIVFWQVGYFDLLRELFHHIAVPTAVAKEVTPTVGQLPGWIEVRHVPLVPTLPRMLDPGEREAIALALALAAEFVALDDLPGRRVAAGLGFTVIGSFGLLIRAKRRGLMDDVRPTMDSMVASGLYVTEQLYREILDAAGEANG